MILKRWTARLLILLLLFNSFSFTTFADTLDEVPADLEVIENESEVEEPITVEGIIPTDMLLETLGLDSELSLEEIVLDQKYYDYALINTPRPDMQYEDSYQRSPYDSSIKDTYPKRTLIPNSFPTVLSYHEDFQPIAISDVSFNVDVIAEGAIGARPQPPIPTKHAMYTTTRALEDSRKTSLNTVFAAESFKGEYNPDSVLDDVRFTSTVNQLLPDNGFICSKGI